MKKCILIVLAIVLAIMLTAGCTPTKNDGLYTAEFPYDPLQYMLFLKKEISVTTNQLTSCAVLAASVADGHYSDNRVVQSAASGLTVIKQCHESVSAMRPPDEYTDARESVLAQMIAIESDMAKLIAELERSSPDKERLEEIKNLLLGDLTAITAIANTYWL